VVIEPADIKKIEPKTTKAMEILEFVKSSQIDPVYFESSYYLVPEEAGQRPYALLTRALEESEYVAIAKLSDDLVAGDHALVLRAIELLLDADVVVTVQHVELDVAAACRREQPYRHGDEPERQVSRPD
jgi:non-homologous end joining protein Ku